MYKLCGLTVHIMTNSFMLVICTYIFFRYHDMVETFGDKVEYVPGGATLNAIRVAQVCESTGVIYVS